MSQIKKSDIDSLVNDVAFAIEAVKQGENYPVTDKDIEEGISALGRLETVARNGSNHATADSCFTEPCPPARRLTGLTSSPQAF